VLQFLRHGVQLLGDGGVDLGLPGGACVGARLLVGKVADEYLLGPIADAYAPVEHLALPLVPFCEPADAGLARRH